VYKHLKCTQKTQLLKITFITQIDAKSAFLHFDCKKLAYI
jgi:hypothetical protein